jgi:hypothetical protein
LQHLIPDSNIVGLGNKIGEQLQHFPLYTDFRVFFIGFDFNLVDEEFTDGEAIRVFLDGDGVEDFELFDLVLI